MKKAKIKKAALIGICCAIVSTGTVLAASDNFSTNNDIKIQINNEWAQEDLEPFIENDRTLISLNEFMEKLGDKAVSDLQTGTIKIYSADVTIEMAVGKNSAKITENVGGLLKEETVNLEISPKVMNEKIFVPLRFAAETLGADVSWDNSLRAVIIKTKTEDAAEKPVEFETVDRQTIEANKLLADLYDENYKNKGMYSLTDGDYMYVLISAGEKSTGGYSMTVDSITEAPAGTAYVQATLHSPEEGSAVTQALTYPSAMVKFKKGDIETIKWALAENSQQIEAAAEKREITDFVQEFGGQLKMVSLLSPEDVLKDDMHEYYGDYVSTDLIEKWLKDPKNAPGKLTSSPWPERIEVLSAEKTGENKYAVKGEIIEVTSVEMKEGGAAAKRPVTLEVEKINEKWVIVSVELGEYEEVSKDSVVYKNDEYGFTFTLPGSWKDYSIQNDIWKGSSLTEGQEDTTGPIIYIRHPLWTEDNPRQDIPIMIFTAEQWESVQNEGLSVSAAPIPPSKLGENSTYVFALPARYNYAFPTGFEEVEKILENNPLKAFEVK